MSTYWLHSGEPYVVQPQDEVREPFHEDGELAYAGAMFVIGVSVAALVAALAIGIYVWVWL